MMRGATRSLIAGSRISAAPAFRPARRQCNCRQARYRGGLGRHRTMQSLQVPTPSGLVAIQKVAVIGAGTMGAGIAQVCAQAGYDTALVDAQPAALAKGMARISEFWDKGIAKGKTTQQQKQEWSGRLRSAGDVKVAVASADLVIEAVPESMELKQKIF